MLSRLCARLPLLFILTPALAQLQWQRPVGPLQLTPRFGAQMVDDAARGRLVLFGGTDYANRLAETWEWDGSQWNERFPAVRPPARSAFGFTYDGVRGRAVVFGGSAASGIALADLWEWDGSAWTALSASGGPAPRSGVVASYDYGRARVVVFGGSLANGQVAADPHWEWDGTVWSQGPTGPAARQGASLSYDVVRGRTVLFGGQGTCLGFNCPTFGETWEFDGTVWANRAVAGPPSRFNAAMTYDPVRNRVLLLGGQGVCIPACTQTYNDAWEWDGTSWSLRSNQGPRVHSHALAYDLARAMAVTFGGIDVVPNISNVTSANTTAFDGTNWSMLARAALPPAILGHRLEYDAARGRTVFFGNAIPGNPGRSETWEFDGSAWLQKAPVLSPPPRTDFAMSYDSGRQRIVLFGGTPTNAAFLNDTWEWDGSTWAPVVTSVWPPGQYAHAMAYDSVRARTVLVPGAFGQNLLFEFDGTTWQQRPVAVMPPSRLNAGLTFDRRRARTVLFGGAGNTFLNDTWEWDGAAWIEAVPVQRPTGRTGPRLVYDGARGRTVLFGGAAGNWVVQDDVWEYDGLTWTPRAVAPAPSPRMMAGLAYDEGRHRVVLLGGSAGPGRGTVQDTWELFAPCDRFGPGEVAGGGLSVDCTTPPQLGSAFCVGYGSPGGSSLQFLWLSPGPCGLPTTVATPAMCAPSLFYAAPTVMLVATSNPATFCVALPNNPVFAGLPLCVQGASLATQGCFLATDSLGVVVQ